MKFPIPVVAMAVCVAGALAQREQMPGAGLDSTCSVLLDPRGGTSVMIQSCPRGDDSCCLQGAVSQTNTEGYCSTVRAGHSHYTSCYSVDDGIGDVEN